MPTPSLPLPADVRVTAIRGFIAILRRDPELKRVVKNWRAWEGKDGEAAPPTASDCPWIRITATPLDSSWFQTGPPPTMLQPVRIEVETAVAGTNLDNSVNLWGAIERAIFRDNPGALEAVGISGVEVKQPGWGQSEQDATGVDMIRGDGVIHLTVYVAAGT